MGMKDTYYKLRVVWWKTRDYVRYDLREIAFPSSLPDPPGPPGFVKPRKLTLMENFMVLKKATRLYCASWVRDIGPDLRPEDYKKLAEEKKLSGDNNAEKIIKEGESSMWEDLAVAASGGMETLRPALQRVYMTKASTYKDAMVGFIQGYQEGLKEVLEKEEESKAKKDGHAPKEST